MQLLRLLREQTGAYLIFEREEDMNSRRLLCFGLNLHCDVQDVEFKARWCWNSVGFVVMGHEIYCIFSALVLLVCFCDPLLETVRLVIGIQQVLIRPWFHCVVLILPK